MNTLRLRKVKSSVEAELQNSASIYYASSRFRNERDFVNAAKELKLENVDWLKAQVSQFKTGCEDSVEVAVPVQETPRAQILLTNLTETVATALSFADLGEALLCTERTAEPLLRWDDIRLLCALDIDLLEACDTETIRGRVTPLHVYEWRTHGGGLRYIYEADSEYNADEKAAVVASLLLPEFPIRCELKTSTRHPAFPRGPQVAGPIIKRTPAVEVSELVLNSSPAADEVARWLDEKNLEVGQRYDHTQCPGWPSTEGHREPVVVYDWGIKCYFCEGHGRRAVYSYSALCPSEQNSLLIHLARCRTHWAHARVLLADAGLPDMILAGVYRACMVACGTRRGEVERVFTTGKHLIRYSGYWGSLKGEPYNSQITEILSDLPAVSQVDAKGQKKVNRNKVELLNQNVDLTNYGYPAVTPIWGVDLYGIHLTHKEGQHRMTVSKKFPATYLLPHNRTLSIDEAWQEIEAYLPGINRKYLMLLLAAKAYSEAETGRPPLLYVTGPTGSAKSATVAVAAAITADHVTEYVWNTNQERVYQAVGAASTSGSWVVFNEIMKICRAARLPEDTALDWLLNLSRDVTYHRLYAGPTKLGRVPAVVLTDVGIPHSIKTHEQICRRVTYVRLQTRVYWETPLARHGIAGFAELRGSPSFALAADHILSYFADEYLSQPVEFDTVAAMLNWHTLGRADELVELHKELAEFYRLVVTGKRAEGAQAHRFGKKYVIVNRDGTSPLDLAYQRIVGESPNPFERFEATDWAGLLKSDREIRFIGKTNGRLVAVQFVDGEGEAICE